MQIYRGFDIGSGKPSPEEIARAPHHLIGVLDPNEAVDAVVDTIMSTVRRLHQGDGFISVAPLEQCYRISTGNPQI